MLGPSKVPPEKKTPDKKQPLNIRRGIFLAKNIKFKCKCTQLGKPRVTLRLPPIIEEHLSGLCDDRTDLKELEKFHLSCELG